MRVSESRRMSLKRLAQEGWIFRAKDRAYYYTASGLRYILGVGMGREEDEETLRKLCMEVRHTFVEAIRGERGVSESLAGACGLASHVLACVLLHRGYLATTAWGVYIPGEPHAWVETRRYILDLTQTQFGGVEVVVQQKGDPYMKCKEGLEVDRTWSKWTLGPCQRASKWEEVIDRLGRSASCAPLRSRKRDAIRTSTTRLSDSRA